MNLPRAQKTFINQENFLNFNLDKKPYLALETTTSKAI
ncbi:hypothetical protein X474_15515 [Dethiosulfatarculus sandiegensis]|uniref:Uncharacterized protein n=1 Tax=Dethiosulfatarculus sandiegensis TaxID=1429043 RepID=A0A0D2JBL4_9BACT|nr:hypothetical protein X474_15515 [Dethiosulfatarculus sandiegensis]